MKYFNTKSWVVILGIILLVLSSSLFAEQKLAQTGFQFLSVATEAKGGAMASAMTSIEMNSGALFFNPAGMARMTGRFSLSLTQNNWIADITHNSVSMAVNPMGGRIGVFGLSFMSVDYGELQGTMVWENEQGYIDTEIFEPSAFMVGFGYAKSLTDKFAVGGQVKYTGQELGKSMVPVGDDSLKAKKNLAFATAYDFGTIYKTGWKSLQFGMSVRNFSQEIEYEKESFLLPLTFRIGISMDLMDFLQNPAGQSLIMSVDASHPRSYPEQLRVGFEYSFLETFYGRLGYVGNSDENNITYGFGLQKFGFAIDYAYTPFGVFDNVQRFTIKFAL
jgi:opacity protein-like surface antigen